MMEVETPQDPRTFWEDFYLTKRTASGGKPSAVLVRYADDLPAGTALDLGASHGDDVLWLAERGWQATGIDISETALERARQRARDLGLDRRARFEARDLAAGLPKERFDLVTALYFQSPVELPRPAILRAAAALVAPGGHILVVAHAAPPPWAGDMAKEQQFPTVESELEALDCNSAGWTILTASVVEREGTGPDGIKALLQDTIVMARRNRGN